MQRLHTESRCERSIFLPAQFPVCLLHPLFLLSIPFLFAEAILHAKPGGLLYKKQLLQQKLHPAHILFRTIFVLLHLIFAENKILYIQLYYSYSVVDNDCIKSYLPPMCSAEPGVLTETK